MIGLPSNNFDERTQKVDMLVMHYTGMQSAQAALEKLRDETPGKRVSAHYLVDEDGTVYALVPEDKRAWHAGVSKWRGQGEINSRSIGIEIVNPGHEFGYRAFPEAQMQAVAKLSREIISRHNIQPWNVVAHSDIAPGRKQDPGELFPWKSLAAQGIGIWPKERAEPCMLTDPLGFVARVLKQGVTVLTGEAPRNVLEMQKDLARIGYDVPLCGSYGPDTRAAVTAFQRHFRPEKVDGQWDAQCQSRLQGLLERVPHAKIDEPDGRMAALAR